MILGIFLAAVIFGSVSSAYGESGRSGNAQQQGTPVITDTPQDGNYIHTVRKGETLAGIAQAYGVTIDTIRALNDLPAGTTNVSPGTFLIIHIADATATLPPNATVMIVTATFTPVVKFVIVTATPTLKPDDLTGTARPTVTPSPTIPPSPTVPPSPTRPTETPTLMPTLVPLGGSASLCVTAFNDTNTNHWFDNGEALIAGATLNLAPPFGGNQQPQQATTTSDGPSCFSNIAPGQYTVDAKVPDSYGPTTPTQLNVQVAAGERVDVSFGAAQGYQPPQPDTSSAQTAPSATPVATTSASLLGAVSRNIGLLVLGIAGVILLGGLSVIFIARRQ
jgi:hypothetical protein